MWWAVFEKEKALWLSAKKFESGKGTGCPKAKCPYISKKLETLIMLRIITQNRNDMKRIPSVILKPIFRLPQHEVERSISLSKGFKLKPFKPILSVFGEHRCLTGVDESETIR